MASSKAAWGIEIGADSIKAIRLERDGDDVSVSDFIVIPHKKVLTTPDLDQDEMIRLGLGQFISQKALEGEHLVMSVPGHAAFARFAKLPPVDPKKVADIVKFEAVQQIPFPIDQVEWDYQTFTKEGLPDIEVGIFAITREKVQQRLSLYGELGIQPDVLTLSPVAVYNAMVYDMSLGADHQPLVFLDIGTSATDLIIADEGRCWIRTFPLGGTHFTDAIVNSFKLSYSKAEKLKQESTSSKYAKQIMQAMRPVFSDLLQDVQRSLGYYASLHRDRELKTMIGLGSTFKIPGLRKFLGQQLQMEVLRLDEYRRIRVEGREAAAFAANAVNMATAYGLALQGVGLVPIAVNLMPVQSLRQQVWHSKTKWFAAAAAIVIAAAGTMFIRPIKDQASLQRYDSTELVKGVITRGNLLKKQYQEIEQQAAIGFTAENYRRLLDQREIWPFLLTDVAAALQAAGPQPQLLTGTPEEIAQIPVPQRKLVLLEKLDGAYAPVEKKRRIQVTMDVTFSHADKGKFLNDTIGKWLRDNAERPDVPYRILPDTISINPGRLVTVTVTDTGETSQGPAPGASPPPAFNPAPPPGGSGSPAFGIDSGTRRRGGSGEGPTQEGGVPSIGGGTPAPGGPSTPPADGGSPGPTIGGEGQESRDADEAPVDVDAVAPIPAKPSLFKAGDQYFRVPITFEVELIDTAVPPAQAAPEADPGNASEQPA
jgi:type IV pilus assembly protein PilM